MWVDKGREFYNKDVQKLDELYSTENEEKSYVIERYNRTIMKKLFKCVVANNTRKVFHVLDLFVDQYNNAIHSSVKMTRSEASRKENETKVWKYLYSELGGKTLK